jgi:hypothetical protein
MASTVVTLPRGPETLPEQQARQWIERPLELLDTCARQFGDVFTRQLGALGATVMFSHPEAVKTIFSAPSRQFECQDFNESYRFVMGDHALFLQDGERHRQIKRVMAPPLCHEGMEGQARDIRAIAQKTVEGWSADRRSLAVRPLMHELALRVLTNVVFGAREQAGGLVVHWFKTEVWRDQRAWKPWTNLSRFQPRLRALISSELDSPPGQGATRVRACDRHRPGRPPARGGPGSMVCRGGPGRAARGALFPGRIVVRRDQLRRVFSTTADQYELRSYPGRAALFILSERDGMSDSLFDPALGDIDPQLGWGRVVAGGVEVYEVPGEHVSIFREPNVRSLAEKLTNCLEMARETALK